MRTTGNTLLITGGTSGIGKELVKQFYERGNAVIAVSATAANLDALQQEFPAVVPIVCDLSNANSVRTLVEQCNAEHRDINVLINNAGVQYPYAWCEERDGFNKIEREIAVNFTSPMLLTYGLLPLLLQKEQAAIVNISSGLAYAPKKTAPVYCGTKAAIHSATQALRYQLEGTSTTVFEIIPALVDTPMTQGRGDNKITPAQLVDEFMRNFARDKTESNIGKTKLLKFLHHAAPWLANAVMKNG